MPMFDQKKLATILSRRIGDKERSGVRRTNENGGITESDQALQSQAESMIEALEQKNPAAFSAALKEFIRMAGDDDMESEAEKAEREAGGFSPDGPNFQV